MQEIPTVKGRVVGTLLKVDCPHCFREHTHGKIVDGKDQGHRLAHCAGQLPSDNSGYFITVD